MTCPKCDLRTDSPLFVAEFAHSRLFVGTDDFFPGYSVLVLKDHARELHQLPARVRAAFDEELAQSAAAVWDAFQPHKLNYAALGNVEPHLHWHIIPRYNTEADYGSHPFLNVDRHQQFLISDDEARRYAARIRKALVG